MVALRQPHTLTLLTALAAVALAAAPALAADVTTPFSGKAVNGGTVTHEHRDGRHVLRVSDDFKVPGSPDPHWQVVDSKGNTYLLDRLVVGEDVVGAIGVSGAASAQQDEAIALAGAAAARALKPGLAGAATTRKVTFIDRRTVAAGFDKGAVLVNTGHYMVHASHRDADGIAELHTLDTDIIYVLEGAATLVTGGGVPEARPTEPNELRGPTIVGGDSRRVVKGDVIVVPAGVPHMFTDVHSPLNYYVVKVR